MAQLLTALNFGEMGALKSAEISDFLHVKNNNISDVTAEKKNKQKFKKKNTQPCLSIDGQGVIVQFTH